LTLRLPSPGDCFAVAQDLLGTALVEVHRSQIADGFMIALVVVPVLEARHRPLQVIR